MADLNSGTTIGGNTAMHTGGWTQADVGYFTTGDGSVTGVGFEPRYLEIYGNLHQSSFNSEYQSGGNVGGGANAIAISQGVAVGSATSDQLVNGWFCNSNSMNGSGDYIGDGEVIYLVHTSNSGSTIDGRVRGAISSFDADGFSLSWNATYTNTQFIYCAYK